MGEAANPGHRQEHGQGRLCASVTIPVLKAVFLKKGRGPFKCIAGPRGSIPPMLGAPSIPKPALRHAFMPTPCPNTRLQMPLSPAPSLPSLLALQASVWTLKLMIGCTLAVLGERRRQRRMGYSAPHALSAVPSAKPRCHHIHGLALCVPLCWCTRVCVVSLPVHGSQLPSPLPPAFPPPASRTALPCRPGFCAYSHFRMMSGAPYSLPIIKGVPELSPMTGVSEALSVRTPLSLAKARSGSQP